VAIYLVLFAVAWSARAVYLAETADQPFFRLPLVDAGEYHAIAKAWRKASARSPSCPGSRGSIRSRWRSCTTDRPVGLGGQAAANHRRRARLRAGGRVGVRPVAAAAPALDRRPAAAFYGPLIHVDGELLAESWAACGWWPPPSSPFATERPRGGLTLAFGALGALMLFTRPPLVAAWLPLLLVAAARWIRPRAAARRGDRCRPAGRRLRPGRGAVRADDRDRHRQSALPARHRRHQPLRWQQRPSLRHDQRSAGLRLENLTLWPELHGARTDDEKDAFYRQQAWRDVRENPAVFVRNLGAKTRQFFSSREIPRNVDVYVVRDASRLLRALTWKIGPFGFPFGLLIGFAAIGLWTGRPRTYGLALAIAGYALAIIAVHVCDRYRLPAIPLFIALAAGGAWTAWEAARERRFGHVAAGAATIVLLGVLASVGGRFCAETIDYRAELSRLVAITAYEQRDYPLAEACARQAVAQNPQDAQAWNQLGLLAIRRGESVAAEDLFRRAADSDPACAQAWFNLGKAANKRGDFATAIGHYREGLRHSPAFLPAWIDLGDLLRQTGARDDAAACYREV
jgi:tetratricopeptide (TPR) repeat protein